MKAIAFDLENNKIPFNLARIYEFHSPDRELAAKYSALAGNYSDW